MYSMLGKKTEFSTVMMSRLLRNYGPVFLWFTIYVLISGALQLDVPYPWDNDTAYHAAVGRLIREHGILHSFPWTPFSWLADHYADKELLFHLLFVPFANLDWITASQIVGTLAGAALLLVLYLILRKEDVRFAGLWSLISLSGSVYFIFRFILVRPHLLSIPLALIFLWAAVRGRFVILALVSAVYPWAYVAFWQLPALLLIAAETARFLSSGRVQWKPAAMAAAGIVVGVAVHPNAVNLLKINWIHMSDIFFKNTFGTQSAYEMGTEFAPFPLTAWVQGLLFSVLMIIVSFYYAWRGLRKDSLLPAFTLAAFGFCILTIRTARFCEYFVPFSVAAMAFASREVKWRFLPHAILGVSMLYTVSVGPGLYSGLPIRINDMPPDIENYLRLQIPKHSQVFTTDWDRTGLLMLILPDRQFMVALDPTLFYLKDPELYLLWHRICREAPPGSSELIRRRFGARYVLGVNIPATKGLYSELIADHSVRLLLNSRWWFLFDLGETEKHE